MKTPKELRCSIVHVLLRVESGEELSSQLDYVNADQRQFIQAVCYGVLRNYFRLHAHLNQYIKKIEKLDKEIYWLLLSAFFELFDMHRPAHAVVSESVKTCYALKKMSAKSFVNAILRRAIREKESVNDTENLECIYNHPLWFIQQLQKAYPDHWESILNANQQHPPMMIRVNRQKTSRDDYATCLLKNTIKTKPCDYAVDGLELLTPMSVNQLPEFENGFCYVQDASAQLAVTLLDLKPGLNVLDACAAPGGKTTHILECEPHIQLLALDQSERRIQRIHENLKRLQLSAKVQCADVSAVDAWWNGELFDRILLDVPCSATGVIRRHPDIKLHRKPEEITFLAKQQLMLLSRAWSVLKSGGRLIYATCSVLPEENEQVIKAFLSEHNDAAEQPINALWGMPKSVGRQVLPGQNNMDGFYYCELHKKG